MYRNRTQAGEELVRYLKDYAGKHPYLLAIPRGGIVVAAPIARALNLPVHVLVTRKLGHPQNPEVAIGAVMPDGSSILDEHMISRLHLSERDLADQIRAEYAEVQRRLHAYANSLKPPEVKEKTILLIDDGIATGYTIRAAIRWLRTQAPAEIIAAVPVAPPDVAVSLRREVDALICPLQPPAFMAVGMYYQQFPQTSEQEVIQILHNSQAIAGDREKN